MDTERRTHIDNRYVNKKEFESGLIRQPKSWADVVAILAIMGFVGGIAQWVYDLKNNYVQLAKEFAEAKAQINHGILPITEERIRNIEVYMKQHNAECRQERMRLEGKMDSVIQTMNQITDKHK